MAYIDAEVTAFLVVVDARKASVTAALGNFQTVRPLIFPEYASAAASAFISSVDAPDYTQTSASGTSLSTALTGVRDDFDSAKTAWEAFLTARNLLTTPPYNQTNTGNMLTALATANTGSSSCTTALANVNLVRPLLLPDYAGSTLKDALTQTAPPRFVANAGGVTAVNSAISGLGSGLDTAVTDFAAIITARAAVTGP